jgi:hypothetical protein
MRMAVKGNLTRIIGQYTCHWPVHIIFQRPLHGSKSADFEIRFNYMVW